MKLKRLRLRLPLVRLPAALDAQARRGWAWAQAKVRELRKPKPRKWPVMQPFVNLDALWRKFALVLTPVALFFVCLIYGFFFALTAPYLIIAFAVPIGTLMLLAVWALPERTRAPTKTMELLFSSFMICLILWPNYLALALPGLPWITAVRLTGVPLAMLFLVSLSTSPTFRSEVKGAVVAVPGLWMWFTAFLVMQVVTILLSKSPSTAVSKTLIQQVDWTIIAAAAAWISRIPGRPERYLKLVLLTTVPMLVLGVLEFYKKHLLWAGYVPSWLKIDDPIAVAIFSSSMRNATGLYRAKAVFSTPLGLAEFFGLLTPFAIHFAIGKYPRWLKISCFCLVPALFYGLRLTDGRLGVLAFLTSIFLYMLIWGMLRFRRNRRDLLAATIIYAYPALFVLAAVVVKTVKPINLLVFGGGAQVASNLARQHQIVMALPKMMLNPIGHGSGGAGQAMGYAEGSFIAIDNYYLVIGLDYGMIGVVTFLGIFLLTIGWAVRSVLVAGASADREVSLLTPLAVAMTAFLVVKLVFAQADMHPLFFAYLGMTVALIQRARREAEVRLEILETEPAPRQPSRLSPIRRPDWDEEELGRVGSPDEPNLMPPRRPSVA